MASQLATNIQIESIAAKLRYIVWKKLRHFDDPAHHPAPDEAEERYLQEQLALLLETDPQDFVEPAGTEEFWNAVDRYLGKLRAKWKNKENIPNPEVLAANLAALEEQKAKQATVPEKKLATSLEKYLGLDPQNSAALTVVITEPIPEDPKFAAQEAVHVLDDMHALMDKPADNLASNVLLSTISPEIASRSDEHAAIIEYVSTETELPPNNLVVTTTAFAAFSEADVSYPAELPPTVEAAIVAVSMMLDQLGATEAAQRVERAVMSVTATKLKSLAAGKMGYTTSEVGDLVVAALDAPESPLAASVAAQAL